MISDQGSVITMVAECRAPLRASSPDCLLLLDLLSPAFLACCGLCRGLWLVSLCRPGMCRGLLLAGVLHKAKNMWRGGGGELPRTLRLLRLRPPDSQLAARVETELVARNLSPARWMLDMIIIICEAPPCLRDDGQTHGHPP